MKTATIPSLRVAPELRAAAENILQEGETLSSFVEDAIRSSIERRHVRSEFISRGLASRDEAKHSGEYLSSDSVLKDLDRMLTATEKKKTRSG